MIEAMLCQEILTLNAPASCQNKPASLMNKLNGEKLFSKPSHSSVKEQDPFLKYEELEMFTII